jgi:hypothetical protein
MKNMKYSISACCLILSFILVVPMAYSVSPQTNKPAISTVRPSTPARIEISSPIANQKVLIGSTCKIEWWKIGEMSQFVNILLVQGQTSKVIASNVPNNGYYEWLTPDIYGTGKFSFRISTVDNMIKADSNVFDIAKVANPNEKEIFCPDKIAIDSIPTQPANTTEFIGMVVANLPATFTLNGASTASNTVCFCEYRLGQLIARIQAKMVGYTSCNAGFVSLPNSASQAYGITLYK